MKTQTSNSNVIKGKAGRYTFQPYDVLQIRKEQWTDFSTLRTETEARQAVAIVDSGRFMDTMGKFRIVRNTPPPVGRVVYGELQLITDDSPVVHPESYRPAFKGCVNVMHNQTTCPDAHLPEAEWCCNCIATFGHQEVR